MKVHCCLLIRIKQFVVSHVILLGGELVQTASHLLKVLLECLEIVDALASRILRVGGEKFKVARFTERLL